VSSPSDSTSRSRTAREHLSHRPGAVRTGDGRDDDGRGVTDDHRRKRIGTALHEDDGERNPGVPEDLAVVGYDNIYTSTINRVSLTTVDRSGRETGAASICMLMERIDGRTEPQQSVIAPPLVTRGTSGPPPPLT
jgi:Periplasmic binding protein-like domain